VKAGWGPHLLVPIPDGIVQLRIGNRQKRSSSRWQVTCWCNRAVASEDAHLVAEGSGGGG
jgi:hypothetical protein